MQTSAAAKCQAALKPTRREISSRHGPKDPSSKLPRPKIYQQTNTTEVCLKAQWQVALAALFLMCHQGESILTTKLRLTFWATNPAPNSDPQLRRSGTLVSRHKPDMLRPPNMLRHWTFISSIRLGTTSSAQHQTKHFKRLVSGQLSQTEKRIKNSMPKRGSRHTPMSSMTWDSRLSRQPKKQNL